MKNTAAFPALVATSNADNTCDELTVSKAITLPQRRIIVIRCGNGILLLAIVGDAEHYFLRAGASITCCKCRAIVVQAMHAVARFQIYEN